MDQLNRGVKVEGLMLPPGITLTRVDPTSAEGLRAKKEAISRVSKTILFGSIEIKSTPIEKETKIQCTFTFERIFSLTDLSTGSGTISATVGISTTTTVYNWYANAANAAKRFDYGRSDAKSYAISCCLSNCR